MAVSRACHRKLRAALLRGADCLLSCHPHFAALAGTWREAGDDPRAIVVKVAKSFSRILYQIVAGQQVFCHPQCQERHYILNKLVDFQVEPDTPSPAIQRDLEAAIKQLPPSAYAAEAAALEERLKALASGRAKDPQGLASLLPKVLARLGVKKVKSKTSGAPGPR